MQMTKLMTKLLCPECQRENESERIYCHDCGARLDRSGLAKTAPKGENIEQTQRRLKQLLDPKRLKMRLLFFRVSKLLLGAAVLAALIQLLMPPRDIPERLKNVELQQLNIQLENLVMSHSATPLQFTDGQVNTFLANIAKSKQTVLNKYLKFERAFVSFDEGMCLITVERSWMDYSVFHSVSYNVALQNGTLIATPIGGKIGRMPIHPELMKYCQGLFQDLWTALDAEKKLVLKLGSIEFHPHTMVLIPKQASPAPGT
jgi:hypothetical protein